MGQEFAAELDAMERNFNIFSSKRWVIDIQVNRISGHAAGGAIQRYVTGGYAGFPRMSGSLSGYGGGDQVKALLEPGEFILRKEAVRKYGLGYITALNAMQVNSFDLVRARLGGLIDSIKSPSSVRSYQEGGATAPGTANGGDEVTVNFAFPGGERVPARMGRAYLQELQRALNRYNMSLS